MIPTNTISTTTRDRYTQLRHRFKSTIDELLATIPFEEPISNQELDTHLTQLIDGTRFRLRQLIGETRSFRRKIRQLDPTTYESAVRIKRIKLLENTWSKRRIKRIKSTIDDLAVLIPQDGIISKEDLYAQATGKISRDDLRSYLAKLLREAQIFIHKIPRSGKKSATGYNRTRPVGPHIETYTSLEDYFSVHEAQSA